MPETTSTSTEASPDAVVHARPRQAQLPRQKRWATKVKTGCLTCRRRRVKCDEGRPVCAGCLRGGRDCEYDSPDPKDKVKIMPLVNFMEEKFLQAFTYYIREMFPVDTRTNPSGVVATQSWRPQTTLAAFPITPVLLILTGAHYITKTSLRAGADPVIGELPSLTPAWQDLHSHMIEAIKELNHNIGDPNVHYRTVLQIIAALYTVEMAIPDTAWPAHLEGLAVLIKEYGGVLDLMETNIRTVMLKVQGGICYSTVGNSTSPVSRQMVGYLDWTPTEVSTAYGFNMMSGFPCPCALFQLIIRVTKLRVRCGSLLYFPPTLVREVLGVMDDIEEFDPETWEEVYSFESQPNYVLWGYTFKAAVGLYLCASLPPVLVAKAVPPSFESAKRNYVDRLMASISALQLTDDYSVHGLAWPLAVLGVGVADLQPVYRRRVEEMFAPLHESRIADPISSSLLIKKLRKFWLSGHTAWDECFYAPYNVLTA